MKMRFVKNFLALLTLLTPMFAKAHIGVGAVTGVFAGFAHPLSGWDHFLAMLAVGLWAAQLAGRATWLVPLSFVLTMLFGGMLAILNISISSVEFGIVLSVLSMGALIAMKVKLPISTSMIIVGIFALFHGHAHGTEMSLANNYLTYAIGFVGSTTLLHVVGISTALLLRNWNFDKAIRAAGLAISLTGAYMVVNLLS